MVIQADYAINVGRFFVLFSTSDRVINCAFLPDLTAPRPLSLSLSDFAAAFPRREEIAVSFHEVGWSIPTVHAVCAAHSRLQLQRKQIIGSGGGVGDKLGCLDLRDHISLAL